MSVPDEGPFADNSPTRGKCGVMHVNTDEENTPVSAINVSHVVPSALISEAVGYDVLV